MFRERERESKSRFSQIIKITLTSLIAALACTGIIYAATTVGTNISTTGTLTATGLTTMGNASSTLFSISNTGYIGGSNGLILADGSITDASGIISFGNENLSTIGTLTVTGLTTLGNASTTVLSVSGNLMVGNGTPTITLDGEDVYIEGTFEVDGAVRFDGAITGAFNSGATITVCASDRTANKWKCDYTCDGTADQVQINAAIAALSADGGIIQLTEGTFTIATNNSIVLNQDSVWMRGTGGTSTTITPATGGGAYWGTTPALISVSGTDVTVSDLEMDLNYINNDTGVYYCLVVEQKTLRPKVLRTQCHDSVADGIVFDGTQDGLFADNYVYEITDPGLLGEDNSCLEAEDGNINFTVIRNKFKNCQQSMRMNNHGDVAQAGGRVWPQNSKIIIKDNMVYPSDSDCGNGGPNCGAAVNIYTVESTPGTVSALNIDDTITITGHNLAAGEFIDFSATGCGITKDRPYEISEVPTANTFKLYGEYGDFNLDITSTACTPVAKYAAVDITVKDNIFIGVPVSVSRETDGGHQNTYGVKIVNNSTFDSFANGIVCNVVDCLVDGNYIYGPLERGIEVLDAGTIVVNNHIKNAGDYGIYSSRGGIKINGNVIDGTGINDNTKGQGVYIQIGGGTDGYYEVKDNTFRNINADNNLAIQIQTTAIDIAGIVSGNIVYDAASIQVDGHASYNNRAAITNNHITGGGGIYVKSNASAPVTLTGNYIQGANSSIGGIKVETDYATITGNAVTEMQNGYEGIFLSGDYGVIANNTITNGTAATTYCITVNGTGALIEGNTLDTCYRSIQLNTNARDVVIRNNTERNSISRGFMNMDAGNTAFIENNIFTGTITDISTAGNTTWINNTGGIILTAFALTADDVMPDVSYRNSVGKYRFTLPDHTGVTAITDLDNPVIGSFVTLVGLACPINCATIADSGNFNLTAGWTQATDASLTLYIQADNDYIEVSRVAP